MSDDDRVRVTAVGPFGRAVAQTLRSLLPLVGVSEAGEGDMTDTTPVGLAPAHVVAAWRPCQALCDAIAARCADERAVFLPVILEAPHIRVGPLVVPGVGACFTCYRKRRWQHAARPAVERALLDHYDAHPDDGPQGFLSVIADLAAVRAAQLLCGGTAGRLAAAGQVWRMDYLTRATDRSVVTGVHGCPGCGLQRDEQTRSYADLTENLDWLWSAASAPAVTSAALGGAGTEARR